MVNTLTRRASLGILALTSVLALGACSEREGALAPSGNAVGAPDATQSFDAYVSTTRDKIRDVIATKRFAAEDAPFGAFTLDQVVDMRAPYAVEPDATACQQAGATAQSGANTGFLLVHGLTDGPYWLGDIRDDLHERFPCATLHGVLLPGHGTVPGDLIDVSYEDWLETVRFGIDAFDQDIDKIIPIGFSTGAALIGRDFIAREDNSHIKGLVMLSPGLQAKSDQAWLTPYVRYVRDWVGQGRNNDPGKYGSMAMNAAAEFHLLTAPYYEDTIGGFDVPVFVAISSDDQTVKAQSAVSFFCQNVESETKTLIWYQGDAAPIDAANVCDGIDVVPSKDPELRTLNHAHTGITVSPQNSVYGLNGAVRDCGHYDGADYETCISSPDAMYGERNLLDSVPSGTLRRGTFNPDFPGMITKMTAFIQSALIAD
jgi:esterase/lipase